MKLYWTHDAVRRWHTAIVDYGIKDSKGRSVGAALHIWEPRDGSDERFEFVVQSARDGKPFGAWPGMEMACTLEEAKALAEKCVMDRMNVYQREVATTGGIYLTPGERKAAKKRTL